MGDGLCVTKQTQFLDLKESIVPNMIHMRNDRSVAIRNQILLGLSRQEREQILPEMEFVQLKQYQIIHDASETVLFGYFLNTGSVSMLSVQPDGKRTVEVGVIGNEGFTALPLLAGYRAGPFRLMTCEACEAYRCDVAVLEKILRQSPQVETQLRRSVTGSRCRPPKLPRVMPCIAAETVSKMAFDEV